MSEHPGAMAVANAGGPPAATPRIGVCADVNANVIDGSSVWLQSVSRMLSDHVPCEIWTVLKARVDRTVLIEPLLKRANLRLVRPFEDGLAGDAARHDALDAAELSRLLARLDAEHRWDVLIVRGMHLARQVAADGAFDGRLWLYLTDIPQSPAELTDERLAELKALAVASRYFLCQTTELQSFLEGWIPEVRGKTILMPPMTPDDIAAERAKTLDPAKPLRLIYAGKFAPLWNTLEMTTLPGRLRQLGREIEVHMVGDKIHTRQVPQNFPQDMQRALEHTRGVVWHGGCSREKTIEIAGECDAGLSWRAPKLDRSLELSTKLLEYGAMGLPVILNRNAMHEELLGVDYPLFVRDRNDVVAALRYILPDPDAYGEAAQRCLAASRHYDFRQVAERLRPFVDRTVPPMRLFAQPRRPLRLLIAGHDLKFLTQIQAHLAGLRDLEIRVDQWETITDHDEAASAALLEWADVIWCEWCLANAVWYADRVRDDQRLLVRFHRFEKDTDYPCQLNMSRVAQAICVGPYHRDLALRRFGWPADKVVSTPNWVDTQQLDRPKLPAAEFRLGMIGVAPSRKRLDRGLDVLEALRRDDDRYTLHIKSKPPWEYWWIWNNEGERRHYREIFRRVSGSPLLREAVVWDEFGPDVANWLRKIGYVLSTSDDESFHLSPAEGMASRAVPMLLNWPGAETIYPDEWIHRSTDEIAAHIRKINDASAHGETGQRVREWVSSRYSLEAVFDQFVELICPDAARRDSAAALATHAHA